MLVTISPIFAQPAAQAAQITNRSLTLQTDPSASTPVGGSDPGGTVDHAFSFTLPTSAPIQSIEFQYCTAISTSDSCPTGSVPTGLSTTAVTDTLGSGLSGFTTLNDATNGTIYISDATAYTPAANTAETVTFNGVVNPTATNTTFFVTISTWDSTTPGTNPVDSGNVAASTASQIVLTGIMPESLVFCTGATITETSGIPDCSTATSGNIAFPMLFSPSATAYVTSQMAASTNANHGYVITITGSPPTSGSNTISSMSTATTSTVGSSQFGLNLEVNTTPAVGTAITPASDGVNYFAYPETGYNTANTFKFTSGDTVANSGYSTGSPTKATDAQIYTVSYIVNVPGDQPPGTYTSTLTYICTPTF